MSVSHPHLSSLAYREVNQGTSDTMMAMGRRQSKKTHLQEYQILQVYRVGHWL